MVDVQSKVFWGPDQARKHLRDSDFGCSSQSFKAELVFLAFGSFLTNTIDKSFFFFLVFYQNW